MVVVYLLCPWVDVNSELPMPLVLSHLSIISFLNWFLLEYSCFTMLCYLLLYSKVNHLYIYIYPFFFGFPSCLGHSRTLSRFFSYEFSTPAKWAFLPVFIIHFTSSFFLILFTQFSLFWTVHILHHRLSIVLKMNGLCWFLEYKLVPNCLRYIWILATLCYIYEY